MSNYQLTATLRTALGRKVRALRKTGYVPANIFGKGLPSLAIQLETKALREVLKKAGETNLIDIKIDGAKTHPVLMAGYSQDTVTGELLHVDFHQVDLKVKTTAMVPVHPVGESEAVKSGNILVLQRNEIEVEALPTDLPSSIDLDLTLLTEVSSTIYAKDLVLDRAKVALMLEDDDIIATIQAPAQEEAPAAAEPASDAKTDEVKPAAPEGK